MLKTLLIKDYALIESIEVEFGKGLNIITGETGAGKSIIIDAMSLLLGERASSDVIRKGTQKSIVEGIFEVAENEKVKILLESNEIEFLNELIIRREISLKGTNRCFINDTPVTLNLIKEIGELLVDLHGQHEHQSLLKTETHIELVDQFAGVSDLLNEYRNELGELNKLIKEKNHLKEKEISLKEKKDFYEFQIKEIDAVSPKADEEELLEGELRIKENSEKLLSVTNEIFEELYEGQSAIHDKLSEIKNKLSELSQIDISFKEKILECESAIANINDVASFLRSYKDGIDINPDHLEEIRSRLHAFSHLKKKYGGSIKKVLEYRENIGRETELAENFKENISDLEKQIHKKRFSIGEIAKKISIERKSISNKIKKEIEYSLKELGINDSVFKIIIKNEFVEYGEDYIIVDNNNYHYNENGYDDIEFYISTNAGEDPKPLIKVASGGEISRVMLAIKTILAKSDKLPILIFDEIDTGISGRIAQKVGQSLKSLAVSHQIIAITHLPQIAGFSDYHFSVEKKKISDRVISSIRLLNNEDRVKEVAKLISGENISEAAINGAKELLGYSVISK